MIYLIPFHTPINSLVGCNRYDEGVYVGNIRNACHRTDQMGLPMQVTEKNVKGGWKVRKDVCAGSNRWLLSENAHV